MNAKAQKFLTLAPVMLVCLFLIFASALPKLFVRDAQFLSFAGQLGMTPDLLTWIGILELAAAILLFFPRTATLGFLMLVGLMGGAVSTILTHSAPGTWWWFPLVMLLLVCATAYFTLPELLDRAKGHKVPNTKNIALRIFGWVCVLFLLAMHSMALMGKINPPAPGTPGYDMTTMLGINGLEKALLVVEVVTLVLFLIPRTSAIGGIMMIGYMSGVLADFLTHGLGLAGSAPGIVMLAVAAIAVWIRNPELAQRLLKGKYLA